MADTVTWPVKIFPRSILILFLFIFCSTTEENVNDSSSTTTTVKTYKIYKGIDQEVIDGISTFGILIYNGIEMIKSAQSYNDLYLEEKYLLFCFVDL